MSILTVVRTIIQVANIEIDAYTAGEVSSVTGAPINYLSGRGLAESIGLEESTARQNRLSKELKDLLGNGFTVRQGKYKMDSGGSTKVNLWDTVSAAKYYRYHDRQGNKIAGLIVDALAWDTVSAAKYYRYHDRQGNKIAGLFIDALAATTLDIIINDKLNIDYQKGQAEKWLKARLAGKVTRRSFTDSIKDYAGKVTRRSFHRLYQGLLRPAPRTVTQLPKVYLLQLLRQN